MPSTLKTIRNIAIALIVITLIAKFQPDGEVKADTTVEPTPTVIEKVIYQEPETVEEYIKYVFGEDYPKAMLLLKGDGSPNACAENRTLNPKALNDNTTWGGRGKDWGVFQINDSWQGVQSKFLLNYKINIQIAHQLFEENGKSFKLWTCGKVYEI